MADHIEVYSSGLARIVCINIDNAKYSIQVAMAYLTHSDIMNALARAADRGVFVEFILDKNKNNNYERQNRLVRGGALLYIAGDGEGAEGRQMHHKFAIIDGQLVLSGSFNWTYKGDRLNDENLTVIRAPEQVADFVEIFNQVRSQVRNKAHGHLYTKKDYIFVNKFLCKRGETFKVQWSDHSEVPRINAYTGGHISLDYYGDSTRSFQAFETGVLSLSFAGRSYEFLIRVAEKPRVILRSNLSAVFSEELVTLDCEVFGSKLSEVILRINNQREPLALKEEGGRLVAQISHKPKLSSRYEIIASNEFGLAQAEVVVAVRTVKVPEVTVQLPSPRQLNDRILISPPKTLPDRVQCSLDIPSLPPIPSIQRLKYNMPRLDVQQKPENEQKNTGEDIPKVADAGQVYEKMRGNRFARKSILRNILNR